MSAIRRPDRGNDWCIDFRWKGTRIRKRSPVQTKAGAVAYERELVAEFATHDRSAPAAEPVPDVTFAGFLDQYFVNRVAVHQRWSSRYVTACILKRHLVPFFGQRPIRQITAADIDAFKARQAALDLRPKTVNNHLSALRAALTAASDWGLLREVPKFRWVRVPEARPRYITPTEVSRLIEASSASFWRPFVAFLAYTGCRFGEAAALRWEDVDLDVGIPVVNIRRGAARGVVGPTKTGRERVVPLPSELVTELRRFRHDRAFVFCRPADGKILDPGSTEKHLAKICRAAGIQQISWHVLRHTYATTLTTAGAPLTAVQSLLGHSTIQMTARYAHVTAEALRSAVMLLSRPLHSSETVTSPATVWSPDGHQTHLRESVDTRAEPVNSKTPLNTANPTSRSGLLLD